VDKEIISVLKETVNFEEEFDEIISQVDLSSKGTSPMALLSKPLANNWYSSSWLGNEDQLSNYFWDAGNNWIYHYELGWLYTLRGDNGFWVWDTNLAHWWWSTEKIQQNKVFPWIYSDETKGWVYLSIDKNSIKTYDQQSRRWRRRK